MPFRLYGKSILLKTTYKSYRLCLEEYVLSSAMIADIDSRGWIASGWQLFTLLQ